MQHLSLKPIQEKYLLFGILLFSLMARSTYAALPSPVAPSTAPAAGDWLGLIKGYAKDAGIVIGLILGVALFLWAAWAAIAKFNEARLGKAEWGEVGLLGVIACGVLIFGSYLLGTAAGII
jgi:integrating conjugative element membrane protein (TIGR03745 family)